MGSTNSFSADSALKEAVSPLLHNGQEAFDKAETSYRFRFYQFNMARNIGMKHCDVLMGPLGKGFLQDTMETPFDDGRVDAAFVVLTETRVALSELVRDIQARWDASPPQSGLDSLIFRNAVRAKVGSAGCDCASAPMARVFAKVVTPCTGNVKTMLAFNGKRLKEEENRQLLGNFTFNPEKAFIGASIVDHDNGFRFCFFGTHFPMQKLTAVIKRSSDVHKLRDAKRAYAEILRRVLYKVSQWDLATQNTVIFVQGDLNSRTLLDDSEHGKDVLLELLDDDDEQRWIHADLSKNLPQGRWHEIIHQQAEDLPVTYKFGIHSEPTSSQLTLGDILHPPSNSRGTLPDAHSDGSPGCPPSNSAYREALSNIGSDQLRTWDFDHKISKFKDSHFPAATERIIYWTPDSLFKRMSWSFPRGGYQVLQHQEGSDHRPVVMEARLDIRPKV